MEKEKLITFLRVLVFNIIETIIIFFLGEIMKVDINIRIMFMAIFFLIRMLIGEPKHYKKAYHCAIWSSLVFLSLYTLTSLDIFAIILLTIFAAFLSTGKADIRDAFEWKGKSSNYSDIEEYIKFNEMNSTLIEYEKKLKEKDNLLYLLYKYRFKDGYTFAEISERTNLDNPRIVEKLNQIALSIRLYCGI